MTVTPFILHGMGTDHDRKSWAALPLPARTFVHPIDFAPFTIGVIDSRTIVPRRKLRCTAAHIAHGFSMRND
jgi:hypothetical protein